MTKEYDALPPFAPFYGAYVPNVSLGGQAEDSRMPVLIWSQFELKFGQHSCRPL